MAAPRKRRKNKNFTTFSSALNETLKGIGLNKKIRQYRVWEIWEEIVGPQIAKNSQPAKWQGNTLVIKVKHASWMQELSFMREKFLEKIKLQIPGIRIKDIKFQTGIIEDLTKYERRPTKDGS